MDVVFRTFRFKLAAEANRTIHYRLRAVDALLRKVRLELAAEAVDRKLHPHSAGAVDAIIRTIHLSFATEVALRHVQESDCSFVFA